MSEQPVADRKSLAALSTPTTNSSSQHVHRLNSKMPINKQLPDNSLFASAN